MNKIRSAIVAACLTLLATIGIVATTVAPASAASTGAHCREAYKGINACVTLTWTPNNVVLTSVGHSTPGGCSNLGSPRYVYKQASTSNRYYNWGSRDCGQVEGVYDACNGCTSRTVKVYLKANVPGDFDYEWTFTFGLYSNGSYTVRKELNVGGQG